MKTINTTTMTKDERWIFKRNI